MQITKKYTDANKVNGITSASTRNKGQIKNGWVERVGAIAGGLIVGYLGLQKLNIGNLMISAGSALFFYRSIKNEHDRHKSLDPNTTVNDDIPASIRQTIRIDKPRKETYGAWRALKMSDGVLTHLDEIICIDGHKRYRWEMTLPRGLGQVEWVAEIVEDIENCSISFHTHKSSDVSHAGRIEFKDIPGEQGTEMEVTIDYYPPVEDIGRGTAKALHAYIGKLILEDLSRFKYWLENGCLPKKSS